MSKPDVADNFSQKKAYIPEDESANLSSQISEMMISKCPASVGTINLSVNIGTNDLVKDLGIQKQLDFGASQIYPSKNGAEFSPTKVPNQDGGQKAFSGKSAITDGGMKNFSPPQSTQLEPSPGWKEFKGMKGGKLDDLVILAAEKKVGQLKYESKLI